MPQDFAPSRGFDHRRLAEDREAPSAADDRDPVGRLIRLLARSAARNVTVGVGAAVVSSFTTAVGSYRP